MLVAVLIHPANQQDRAAGKWLLRRVPLFRRWQAVLFDQGYNSANLLNWVQELFGIRAETTAKHEGKGFQVFPKRWIVERTFGWLNRFRRLSKDYEQVPLVGESYIYLAMVRLTLSRL